MSPPIRVRMTAWYAVLLAIIVAALGAFVVLQLKSDLEASVERDLRTGSDVIAAEYAAEGPAGFADVSRTALPHNGSGAQVLDTGGRVILRYGPIAVGGPLAPADVRREALRGRTRLVTIALGPSRERFRAIVSRLGRSGDRVLVLAESLESVEDSVERLIVLLLLAGPAALAATAAGGWWLARKALLPVERMTSEADAISIDRLDERVALPRAHDEIGHLAVTLNAMLERLEQGVREKHQLVADASHELRTPLAVMRSELDVSLYGDDLPPAARAVLESVREEVDRMSRTVANLLTLAQIDEGRLELLPTRLTLREAIEGACRALAPLAAAKQLTVEVDGDGCEAEADAHMLHQALENLIENAIKYAPVGGAVRVTAWTHGDEVGFTVTDNGPGIPAEARPYVFNRFYRVDAGRGRDAGGSGLGLAICREVAAAHGGRVWVESQEGEGSAFSLALPRTADPVVVT